MFKSIPCQMFSSNILTNHQCEVCGKDFCALCTKKCGIGGTYNWCGKHVMEEEEMKLQMRRRRQRRQRRRQRRQRSRRRRVEKDMQQNRDNTNKEKNNGECYQFLSYILHLCCHCLFVMYFPSNNQESVFEKN